MGKILYMKMLDGLLFYAETVYFVLHLLGMFYAGSES